MSRKNKIIISISGIVIVLLLLIGLTYGFYLTRINGNPSDKSVTVSLANLELTYSDGNGLVESNNLIPGESITKTFTIENTGNKKVINYLIYLEDVVNTFEDKNDLKVTLTCTSNGGICSGNTLTYPSSDTVIGINDIEVGEIQEYILKVDFLETNDNQNDNQNKVFSGNIKLKDMKSTSSEVVSNEGENTLEINNSKAIKHLLVYGNSTQEIRSGKNLFNEAAVTGRVIANGTAEKIENGWKVVGNFGGSATSSGASFGNGWFRPGDAGTGGFNLGSGTTVTISADIKMTKLSTNITIENNFSNIYLYSNVAGVSKTATTSQRLTLNEKTRVYQTYTVSESAYYYPVFTVNNNEIEVTNIQVEVGSTATDYEAYGATPSPDIPSEIESVGDLVTDTSDSNYGKYKIPVTASTKNLIYSNISTGKELTLTTTNTEAILNGNSTSNVGINDKDQSITLEPGTYTFSYYYDSGKINSSPDKFWIGIRDTSNWLAVVGVASNYQNTLSQSFTVTKNTSVNFVVVGNGDVDNLKFKYQLEKGSTSTNYVPYKKETTNIYLNEPLRKIGDKSDYIDLKNGKIVRNVGTRIFTNSDTWSIESDANFYTEAIEDAKNGLILSNYQKSESTSLRDENCFISSTRRLNFQTKKVVHTVDDFKTWLNGKKLVINYELQNLNEETVSLPSIITDESTKNIEIGTSTKPSKTQIEYIQ